MNNKQAADILDKYNRWRIGGNPIPMPLPSDITKALNIAVDVLKKMDGTNAVHIIGRRKGSV